MEERYIYLHLNRTNNVCFYVGKGTRNMVGESFETIYGRAYSHRNRNADWHKVVLQDGFKIEIVEEGILTDKVASEAEKRWVAKFWDSGKLVNRTKGGCGTSGYKFPKDLVARLVELRRIKAAEHGPYGVPVYVYKAKTGEFVSRFPSRKIAAKELSVNCLSISAGLKRENHYAARFLFYREYQGEKVAPVERRISSLPRAVHCLDKEGQLVGTYSSIKEGSDHTGMNPATISNCCWGKQRCTIKGFTWRFADVTKQEQPSAKVDLSSSST